MTPMWAEPFGLVAAEAAACGTPVVAFAAGGLSEVVDGAIGICVPPGDTRAMARAVTDAARLDRAEVRSAARRRFGVRPMLDRYLALYDDLITMREAASA